MSKIPFKIQIFITLCYTNYMVKNKISVRINAYGSRSVVFVRKGRALRDILLDEGINYDFPCGGKGGCGKCRALFLSGAPAPTEADARLLTEKMLSDGVRLLCRAVIDEDCEVLITDEPKTARMAVENLSASSVGLSKNGRDIRYGISVDLGTTTIAAALIRSNGEYSEVCRTASCVNSQKVYGDDVISRIDAGADLLSLSTMAADTRADIDNLVQEMTDAEGIDRNLVRVIVVAGNTTMLHILTGKNVQSLGLYPYTPVSLDMEEKDAKVYFPSLDGARLILLPGISAFVGADILSGLYYLYESGNIVVNGIRHKRRDRVPGKALVADLGTNGELCFCDGQKIHVTSTAAGPVFEGAQISCGVPSVEGAICHVTLSGADPSDAELPGRVELETIGDEMPIGLCGTGVMELVSELVRSGIVDETGLLSDEYFSDGFPVLCDGSIRFLQSDIRNVQLAKAAIFSGITTLTGDADISRVFLAGGFGSHINIKKVKNLRIFPGQLNDKIVAAGNLSLKGAAEYVKNVLRGSEGEMIAKETITCLKNAAESVELSLVYGFDEAYIDAMNF